MGVNGSALAIRGYAIVPIVVNCKGFDVTCVVTDNIMVNAILDFLETSSSIIDCGRQLLTFPTREILRLPTDVSPEMGKWFHWAIH